MIHSAQFQAYGADIDRLVELARQGAVTLSITSAFDVDQAVMKPDDERRLRNLRWLAERPMIARLPGPLRFGYSTWDGADVLVADNFPPLDDCIRNVVLPEHYGSSPVDEGDPVAMRKWRKRITDVQHLSAHLMAKHDVFVTSDEDDMWKKRRALLNCGIVVQNPTEAAAWAAGLTATVDGNADNASRTAGDRVERVRRCAT